MYQDNGTLEYIRFIIIPTYLLFFALTEKNKKNIIIIPK